MSKNKGLSYYFLAMFALGAVFLVIASNGVASASTQSIHIENDAQFETSTYVSGGPGTENDPWIIENYTIDASDNHGIWIENTDNYFIIRNCVIENGGSSYHGIYLENAEHGTIGNNQIINDNYGIYADNSFPIEIENNLIREDNEGMRFSGTIENSIIKVNNNSIENIQGYGVSFSGGDNIENSTISLTGNNFENIEENPIYLYETDVYDSELSVLRNTFKNPVDYGYEFLYLDNIQSSEVEIENNIVSHFGPAFFDESIGNSTVKINGNVLENGSWGGIWFYSNVGNGSSVEIKNNEIENLDSSAIYSTDSNYEDLSVAIDNNSIKNTQYSSVYFGGETATAENITISLTRNDFENTGEDNPIYLGRDSGSEFSIYNSEVNVLRNTFKNSVDYGYSFLYLDNIQSSEVEVENNIVSHFGPAYFPESIENSTVRVNGNVLENGYNGGWGGVWFYGSIKGSSVEIKRNKIENISSSGIYFSDPIRGKSFITIENNSIENIQGDGVAFTDPIRENSSVTVDNNLLGNIEKCGVSFGFMDNIENSAISLTGNNLENVKENPINLYTEVYDSEVSVLRNKFRNPVGMSSSYAFSGWDIIQSSEVVMQNNAVSRFAPAYFGDDISNSTVRVNWNVIENEGSWGSLYFKVIQNNSSVEIKGNDIENRDWTGIYFGDPIRENSSVIINNNSISNIWKDSWGRGGHGVAFWDPIRENSSVTVDNNSISDAQGSGVYFSYSYGYRRVVEENSRVEIVRNVMDNNQKGIRMGYEVSGSLDILYNTITNSSEFGILIDPVDNLNFPMLRYNNIENNSDGSSVGVYDNSIENLNTLYNWWGDNSGPSGDGPGTGDNVTAPFTYANIEHDPWLPDSVDPANLTSWGTGKVSHPNDEFQFQGIEVSMDVKELEKRLPLISYEPWGENLENTFSFDNDNDGENDTFEYAYIKAAYTGTSNLPLEVEVEGWGGGEWVSLYGPENGAGIRVIMDNELEDEYTKIRVWMDDTNWSSSEFRFEYMFRLTANGEKYWVSDTATLDTSNVSVIKMKDLNWSSPPEDLKTAYYFDVSASKTKMLENIQITANYSDSEIEGIVEEDLKLYSRNFESNSWESLQDITVDVENNTVTGFTSHLSPFGLFGSPKQARFEVSDLEIDPGQVKVSEIASISAKVKNTGELSGTHTTELEINNKTEDEKKVTLDPGESERVSFEVTKSEPGTYNVKLDELTGSFEVLGKAEFQVSNLEISPQNPRPGEKVKVTCLVRNIGDIHGTYHGTLMLDGLNQVGSTNVSLEPGEEATLEFTIQKDIAGGTYTLSIGGVEKSFTSQMVGGQTEEKSQDGIPVIAFGALTLSIIVIAFSTFLIITGSKN